MNKNLALDIGNTRIKSGYFENDRLVEVQFWNNTEFAAIEAYATNQNVEKIIFCSVAGGLQEKLEQLSTLFHVIELTHMTPVSVLNQYKTPETLGKDRLAAVLGAQVLYPKDNCLVIDAGTCITYDYLSKEGVYSGGNISPGLNMRLKAMHLLTGKLPELAFEETKDLIGTNTKDAMLNGALLGTIFEMEGYYAQAGQLFGKVNVILTGGDAIFFAKKIKKQIFVHPNLVLTGLNSILMHNANE